MKPIESSTKPIESSTKPIESPMKPMVRTVTAGLLLVLAFVSSSKLAPIAQAAGAKLNTCNVSELIAAINAANATVGADKIQLKAGCTYTLTTANSDDGNGPNGLPIVTTPLTIDGKGATIARDAAAPGFRLLQVSSTGNLALQNVTMKNGSATGGGGALLNNFGVASADNSTFSGNSASAGGGIANFGKMTVTKSTISGNTTPGAGGGIENNALGNLTVTNSTLSSNTSSGNDGGGIFSHGTLTVNNSVFSGNNAGAGGGGILGDGALTVSTAVFPTTMPRMAAAVAFRSLATRRL